MFDLISMGWYSCGSTRQRAPNEAKYLAQRPEKVVVPRYLSVGSIEGEHLRNLALPAVAIGEERLLVVVELLACLRREFEVRSLDDRIHRTRFLAQAAIDALVHVDVVARGPPRAGIVAR